MARHELPVLSHREGLRLQAPIMYVHLVLLQQSSLLFA